MSKRLLQLALGVDRISEQYGHIAAFSVLAAAVISAGNAFVRYGFDISSNGWLEIQWYLFAVTVMLGAPLVLKLNEHVRVDIFYGKLKGNDLIMQAIPKQLQNLGFWTTRKLAGL